MGQNLDLDQNQLEHHWHRRALWRAPQSGPQKTHSWQQNQNHNHEKTGTSVSRRRREVTLRSKERRWRLLIPPPSIPDRGGLMKSCTDHQFSLRGCLEQNQSSWPGPEQASLYRTRTSSLYRTRTSFPVPDQNQLPCSRPVLSLPSAWTHQRHDGLR